MKSSVVVATEDPVIISILGQILMKRDCSLLITKSKLHSILKVLTQEVAYFILDYELANNSNLELINIIRKVRPRMPIIIFSEDNSDRTLGEIAELGVFYYALKPLHTEEIEKVIDAAEQFVHEQRSMNCVFI
ncbi:response regulator [candidate division KSB1 bacterium]|nr:response regulator [candidate division KSB1 bacterium]